jgi:hypothetical protein
LTQTEKRILIGEGTFLSAGFVVTVICAVVFTVRIDGKANANAKSNGEIIQRQKTFETQYLKQMDTLNKNLQELNTRMGRIEGKLDSITK